MQNFSQLLFGKEMEEKLLKKFLFVLYKFLTLSKFIKLDFFFSELSFQ